jgi:hypothetical protein
MTNAVSGATNGGTLSLTQTATAGAGGASSGNGGTPGTGGAGGTATSTLTFDDTKNATQSTDLTASVTAHGGAGGGGSVGGRGGGAIATSLLTGAETVDSSASAFGGNATGAMRGNATATASATGIAVQSTASATAGSGDSTAAIASATSSGDGVSGTFHATAVSAPGTGALVQNITANASGGIDGTTSLASSGTAFAYTSFATATPSFTTSDQAVAQAVGAPTTADVNAVLNANPNIKTAFGTSPSYFAIGELGGGYDANGNSAETVTSTLAITIDPSKLASPQDLLLGLYDGTAVGSGFESLTFKATVGTKTLVNKTFTSVAAAETFFTDNPNDLGPIGGINAGKAFTLQISLSETLDQAGSGFDTGLIVGDPPPAGLGRLIQAMSTMGSTTSSTSSPITMQSTGEQQLLAAAHH